jgi:flagellin
MAQVINTNIPSLTAQRTLDRSSSSLETSLQRLSSGLRINSAKDDAAGLSISNKFTSQIRGLNQAVRNASDGISVAQVAEGALGETDSNLQRIRELAVQSANGTNGTSERAALQSEVTQLLAEIDRNALTTRFGSKTLLDGTFTSQSFQVGSEAGQSISISLQSARATALGLNELVADGSVTNGVKVDSAANLGSGANNGIVAETDLTLTVVDSAGETFTTGAIVYSAGASAKEIAANINAAGSSQGINAVATNYATFSNLNDAGTVSFDLVNSGNTASNTATAISAVVSDKSDLTSVLAAINGQTGATGITATFTTPGDKSSLTLTSATGENIGITGFANTTGTGTVDFDGTTVTEGSSNAGIKTGTVTITSTKGTITTAGANADVFAASGTNTSSFSSVAAIDISTAQGAEDALAVADAALGTISAQRGDLGAIQNRLQSTIRNLANVSENVSAARSRIVDADFAAETANLTRASILQQAGISVLAQANALPQQTLALLQ